MFEYTSKEITQKIQQNKTMYLNHICNEIMNKLDLLVSNKIMDNPEIIDWGMVYVTVESDHYLNDNDLICLLNNLLEHVKLKVSDITVTKKNLYPVGGAGKEYVLKLSFLPSKEN